MKEDNSNTNFWAEKLQNLPLPDAAESWKQMRVVLDQEMPVVKQDRRWLYGLLSMLLIIGVCTCPGVMDKLTPGLHKNQTPGNGSPIVKIEIQQDSSGYANEAIDDQSSTPATKQVAGNLTEAGNRKQQSTETVEAKTNRKNLSSAPGTHESFSFQRTKSQNKKREYGPESIQPQARTTAEVPGKASVTEINSLQKDNEQRVAPGLRTRLNPGSTSLRPAVITGQPQPTSRPALTDSVRLQPDSLQFQKRAQLRRREKGFVFAVGFNHFFPIDGQQRTSLNSSGESGNWRDYFPVPRLTYHLNSKFSVVTEAQFNVPQYTRQLMLSQVRTDTNGLGQRTVQSVYIKKLSYFNLPLSVHVSPLKNVNVGAGAQFSKLTHAIGLFEVKRQAANRPDEIRSAKTAPMKGDSSYHLLETNEWRLLADLNYSYRRFLFGMRYNHALEPFIAVPVGNTTLKQARNHSLQVYVRYNLWDQRKM